MLRRTFLISLAVHALVLGLAVWALPSRARRSAREISVACVSLAPAQDAPPDACDDSPAPLPILELADELRPWPEPMLRPDAPAPADDALHAPDDEETLFEAPAWHEIPLSAVSVRQRPAKPVAPPPAAPPVTSAPRPTTRAPVSPRPIAVRPIAPGPIAARPTAARPSVPLRVVHRPSVARYYPPRAQRRGLQGTALVVLLIDARGRVIRTTLQRSSGYRVLDDAALAFARAYRFSPGNGLRRTRLPVSFRLTM